MHRAPFALTGTTLPSEQLAHHGIGGSPLGQGVTMTAMGGKQDVGTL